MDLTRGSSTHAERARYDLGLRGILEVLDQRTM
jgi:hypothetical protein